MALLKFLKGNYSSLSSAAIAEGQILICGDTGEMFVDVAADKRVKIGDYVTVANLDALFAIDATSVPTSRLYYVEGANILARSNGATWDQINKDTGATSIEVVGEGNAVTAASYDAVARKLTLTKGETFATKAELDTLDTFVGDIPEGYTETNVIAYINKKAEETLNAASGGSSESAASVLAALNTYKTENDPKVQANTEAIEALQKANAEGGAVSNAITAAQDAADQAQKEVDELETVVSEYKTANDAAVAKKADADNVYTKSEIDGKVSALENADLAINNKIGTVAEGQTVVGLIEAAQAKADAAYVKPVDGIGSNDLHADVVSALDKANSALQAADIENKADKATTLAGYGIADAYTKDEVDTAVGAKVAQTEYDAKMEALDAEDERIAGLVSDNADAIAAEKERAEGVEADLQGQINLIMNNPDTKDVIDSISEFTQYIADHGEIAEGFRTDIDQNKTDIAAEVKRAGEAESALSDRLDTLEAIDHEAYVAADTALKNELNGEIAKKADATALTAAVEALEGADEAQVERIEALEAKFTGDGSVSEQIATAKQEAIDAAAGDATTKADAAEAAAKSHADGLNTAMSARVDALEAIDHEHANKDELDLIVAGDKAKWDAAEAKAHEHTNSTELAKIADGDVAKWNAAEQNAKDYSDGKLDTARTEISAEIDADVKVEADRAKGVEADLQSAIDAINNAETGILAQAKSDATSKANAAEANAKSHAEGLMSWGEF